MGRSTNKELKEDLKSVKDLESYNGLKEFTILKEVKGGHKKGVSVLLSYEIALIFKQKGLI